MESNIIQIRNLSKIYAEGNRTKVALKHIDLDIYRGEVLALLGVNGAGKTTLSSILATLTPPTSGSILFNGTSIYDSLVNYRFALGFCPQHANLDEGLTVKENLIFSGRFYLMPKELIHQRVEQLMNDFGLNEFAHAQVASLSGGYRQRLSIARAIIHNPQLVIFDEPTVGLDPHIRRQLWDEIRKLQQRGITVILTTHYLDEAEMLSDRVCILHEGRILLIDKSHNLKSQYGKQNLEEVFLHLMEEETV